MSIVIYIQYIH